MQKVTLGIERLIEDPKLRPSKGTRVGLLVHPASVDSGLRHTVEGLKGVLGGDLKALFGPQHGLWGEKQDNMIESGHEGATFWGIPAYSLYGDVRRPTEAMLSEIDVLIADLQDVGCRVYTFASTMLACMEACAEAGVKVVAADRPNPIGGKAVEGNLLDPGMESFVGPHPIPMRHGMTMGELTRLMKDERKLDLDLEVVTMEGWRRDRLFNETGLPWVLPSPNMPTVETALVYPGQVLLEGTNLSEGRGATRPFEIFGAPFIDPYHLKDRLARTLPSGAVFRPLYFEPTFQKWAGVRCGGLQIHVTDPELYLPYRTTLRILYEILQEWGDRMEWSPPPYEYETERMPIDLLIGDTTIRTALENGADPDELEASWMPELASWTDRREAYLAYP